MAIVPSSLFGVPRICPDDIYLPMNGGTEGAVIDLLDAAVWRDLNGVLAEARAHGPVARTADGRRIFLRYADVNEGLRHHAMSTAALDALLLGNGVTDGPL